MQVTPFVLATTETLKERKLPRVWGKGRKRRSRARSREDSTGHPKRAGGALKNRPSLEQGHWREGKGTGWHPGVERPAA